MPLLIPETEREKLASLLTLGPEVLETLYVALGESAPRLRADDLVRDLAARVKLERTILGDVVRVLLDLYWVRAELDMELGRFADEIAEAVGAAKDDRLGPPKEGWESFKAQLVRLLSLDRTLGVTSKASFIARQFPRHFHSARILTDARPVFPTDPSKPPPALIITHTLQMVVREQREDQDWFVALNLSDLGKLKAVIDRAIAKEKSLRELLAKTEVPILDWKE